MKEGVHPRGVPTAPSSPQEATRESAKLDGYSGVSADLIARHVDPHLDEGEHEHCWTVTAFFASEPFRDLRCQRVALREMLSAWQGTVLPPELWSGEAIARAVAQVLANCIGARVTRPEGYEAWVWL